MLYEVITVRQLDDGEIRIQGMAPADLTGRRTGGREITDFQIVGEDIEIGRQNRPQLYALVGHRPPPLVARDRNNFV